MREGCYNKYEIILEKKKKKKLKAKKKGKGEQGGDCLLETHNNTPMD